MSSVGVVPGSDRVVRGPAERRALIEYVRDTPSFQETDWVEWKQGYDLGRKPGRASVAKHLIGFTNRDPDAATRNADGYAYLILGLRSGKVAGFPVHDSADLENWLRPYVGAGVRFDLDYVKVGQDDVLFFTIDPPAWGDDIHCLLQASEDEDTKKAMSTGTIFVRKSGKTEPADASDIRRLTERARRQGATLALNVVVSSPVAALPDTLFSEEMKTAVLGEQRSRLLKGLPPQSPGLSGMLNVTAGETRSRQRFIEQVDQFVEEATRRWQPFIVTEQLERDPSRLVLDLVNDTDDNYEQVVVELHFPVQRASVHLSVAGARDLLKPPKPPPRWGRMLDVPKIDPRIFSGGTFDEIDGDKISVRVQFAPLHVRPRTSHRLPEILLALPPTFSGQELPVRWRATSSSTRGEASGIIELSVG